MLHWVLGVGQRLPAPPHVLVARSASMSCSAGRSLEPPSHSFPLVHLGKAGRPRAIKLGIRRAAFVRNLLGATSCALCQNMLQPFPPGIHIPKMNEFTSWSLALALPRQHELSPVWVWPVHSVNHATPCTTNTAWSSRTHMGSLVFMNLPGPSHFSQMTGVANSIDLQTHVVPRLE